MGILQQLFYFLLTLAFSLAGQIMLKQGVVHILAGGKPSLGEFARHLPQILISPQVVAGAFLCGVGAICWMFVLSMFELSRAIPIIGGLAYIAMFVIGRLFLNERSGWFHFAGIFLVILGLWLLSMKVDAS